MKTSMILGILLLVFGVFALSYRGLTYTEKNKVLDIGPVEAYSEEEKRLPIEPIVGGLALAGGLALIFVSARRG